MTHYIKHAAHAVANVVEKAPLVGPLVNNVVSTIAHSSPADYLQMGENAVKAAVDIAKEHPIQAGALALVAGLNSFYLNPRKVDAKDYEGKQGYVTKPMHWLTKDTVGKNIATLGFGALAIQSDNAYVKGAFALLSACSMFKLSSIPGHAAASSRMPEAITSRTPDFVKSAFSDSLNNTARSFVGSMTSSLLGAANSAVAQFTR